MLLRPVALIVGLAVAALPCPAFAQFCEEPVGEWGRLLLYPSNPEMDLLIAEPSHDEGTDGVYESSWILDRRSTEGLGSPQELEVTVEWDSAPPPVGSVVTISIDGVLRHKATFDEPFVPDSAGQTITVQRRSGEVVPNIYGHLEITIAIHKPSGELFSSMTRKLPPWNRVMEMVRKAARKGAEQLKKYPKGCYEFPQAEPWGSEPRPQPSPSSRPETPKPH